MNTPEKSGEREIAARIIVATFEADTAIQNAMALLADNADGLATCHEALASTRSLRATMASWMFDPTKHCRTCYEVASEVVETCHADSDLCRECLLGEKDEKAIAYFLRD